MSIKAIEFNLELTGHGVVQTGGDEKHLTFLRADVENQRYKNIVYAKGNFVAAGVDEKGNRKLRKILKISGDGLRHAIHAKAMPAHTPNVLLSREARLYYVATADALLRGWLSVSTEDRKRSAYALTSAEDKDAVLTIELFANSERKEEKSADDAAGTGLFARETTGDTKYLATGFINIEEARFISVSDVYGRRAVADDEVDTYRRLLSANMGSEIDIPRYWRRRDGSSNIPEFGILLSDAQVKYLVSKLLLNMSEINIVKSASGYARTSKLAIKSISVPTESVAAPFTTYFDRNSNLGGADTVPDTYANPWVEVTKTEALAEIAAVDAEIKSWQSKQKEAKAAKKQEKDAAKAAKSKAASAVEA